MGNIGSVFARDDVNNYSQRRQDEEEFVREAVAGLELNHQDYQLTLHQYLTQRYADRYNTNTTNYQNAQEQNHQRQRSHETPTDSDQQKPIALASSFNQSNGDLILLSLKGKNLKDIPTELYYHDDITNLDLSNNGKKDIDIYYY